MLGLEQRIASLEKLISLMRPWLQGPFHGMPLNHYNMKVTTVTAAHTASSANMLILCDATSAAFTVTLPLVADAYERVVIIKKVDASANAITVDGSGAETIDGSATKSLAGQYRWIMLVCGDTEWHIVNNSESITVAVTGVPYAAPGLTLGTSNVEGSTNNVLRTDATVLAFDTGSPTTIQPDDSAAAGSVAVAARRDHQHAVATATAGSITPDASAAEGSASSFARSDHAHGIATATAGNQAIGDSASEGDAVSFARSNHVHGMPSYAAPGLTLGTSNVEGSATTLLRPDATILAFDATNPASIDVADSAVVGSAAVVARRDHQHAVTSSSNPGAAASLLASSAAGLLQLVGLGIGAAPVASQIVLPNAGIITTDAGNLEITPAGDIVLDPIGNDVLPEVGYDLNIGSLAKKYLTLHCAELWVETLVAQDTIATIGGRILVGPTTVLTSDLGDEVGDTTITVKHNEMASGDRVYMEADGKVEFMSIDSAPGGAGPYTYTVTRNLDGTGRNLWYAGDAVFNTGAVGQGFIDIYSVHGIKAPTQYGPTIAGNIRKSATYNDWATFWAIGELNGLYGYGSTTYGVGLGEYGGDYVTIEATGGLKFYNNNLNTIWLNTSGDVKIGSNVAAAATTALTIDAAAGDLLIGATGANQANIFWDRSEGKLKFRGNTTMGVEIDTDGSLLAGAGVVKLDADGIVVIVDVGWQNDNAYRFINGSDDLIGILQAYDDGVGNNQVRLKTLGISGQDQAISVEAEGSNASDDYQVYMGAHGPAGSLLSYVDARTKNSITDAYVEIYPIIQLYERSADPDNPAEGYGRLWLSDGTGTGDDGDLMFERTAGGVTAASVLGKAVLDYDTASSNGVTTTNSTSYVDMSSMSVSVTVTQDALVMLGTTQTGKMDGTGYVRHIALTNSSNSVLCYRAFAHTSVANYYVPLPLTWIVAVAAGTHTFKTRWYVNAGTGTTTDRSMWAIAISR